MAVQLKVGKTYEAAQPDTCRHLGFGLASGAGVTILRENEGLFLGDNEFWYNSDGTDQFRVYNYAWLVKEL